MEVLLRTFCFKTANFLDAEAKKLYGQLKNKGPHTSPEYFDYSAFRHAADSIHALGFVLNKTDSPHKDMVIHLGNIFGFKVKED